jgi:serine/threonine-protein kinase
MASAATAAKLQDDIQLALRYELDGTPLVLVNGRKAVAFPPFLYAMVLTRGALDDPAFASLPPANPNAHLH